MLRGSKTELILIEKASTSVLLALLFGLVACRAPSEPHYQLRLGAGHCSINPRLLASNSSLPFFAMRMARSEIISNNVANPMPLSLATCPARGMLDKLRLAFWE